MTNLWASGLLFRRVVAAVGVGAIRGPGVPSVDSERPLRVGVVYVSRVEVWEAHVTFFTTHFSQASLPTRRQNRPPPHSPFATSLHLPGNFHSDFIDDVVVEHVDGAEGRADGRDGQSPLR